MIVSGINIKSMTVQGINNSMNIKYKYKNINKYRYRYK